MFFGAPERILAKSIFTYRHALFHVADPMEQSMNLAWELVAHCRFGASRKSRNKERYLDPSVGIDGISNGEICLKNPVLLFFCDPAATSPGTISAR